MSDDRSGYLGKLLEEERRLVLVPLDPEKPWAAFRRMRALMKRSARTEPSQTERPRAAGAPPGGAEVIPIRRAGAPRRP